MQAIGMGLCNPPFKGKVKATKPLDPAGSKVLVSHVGQHMFDAQNRAVVLPQRQNFEHIGPHRGKALIARPVGVDVTGQTLEIVTGFLTQDQQAFFDAFEIGVEGGGRDIGSLRDVGGSDFAQMSGVQQQPQAIQQGAAGTRTSPPNAMAQLVGCLWHSLNARIPCGRSPVCTMEIGPSLSHGTEQGAKQRSLGHSALAIDGQMWGGMVPVAGIEPATSSLQNWRSTN